MCEQRSGEWRITAGAAGYDRAGPGCVRDARAATGVGRIAPREAAAAPATPVSGCQAPVAAGRVAVADHQRRLWGREGEARGEDDREGNREGAEGAEHGLHRTAWVRTPLDTITAC